MHLCLCSGSFVTIFFLWAVKTLKNMKPRLSSSPAVLLLITDLCTLLCSSVSNFWFVTDSQCVNTKERGHNLFWLLREKLFKTCVFSPDSWLFKPRSCYASWSVKAVFELTRGPEYRSLLLLKKVVWVSLQPGQCPGRKCSTHWAAFQIMWLVQFLRLVPVSILVTLTDE